MNQPDDKNMVVTQSVYKPMAFSLLILISGILIGAGLMYLGMERRIPKKPEPGPEYFSERMMRHLMHELQLTPEQRQQIEPIIRQHFETMHEIRMEARPKISQEIRVMNEAILSILTEPQKRLWEKRVRQIRELFPREGFGPGRGPDRRGLRRDGDPEPLRSRRGELDRPEREERHWHKPPIFTTPHGEPNTPYYENSEGPAEL